MKNFGFKSAILTILSILFFYSTPVRAQEQQDDKVPTPEEMAAKEADRLADLLKLDPGQVFFVDSTLQHDYTLWQDEIKKLQESKVSNYSMYTAVSDKWMEHIDKSYRAIFNDEQWAAYLKSGAAKAQKARAKRKAKIEEATSAKKNSTDSKEKH